MPLRKRSRSRRKRSPSRATASTNNLRVVFSEKQIQKRVRELAKKLNRDYHGKTLLVVGMLGNCLMFLADLVRALKVPVVYHVIRPEIRDSTVAGIALREIAYTPNIDARGKEVLLVEGILQSGLTLDHVYRYLLSQDPKSIRTAALVEKTDERKVDVPTDYVGFKASGKYLVGYGLGHDDKHRNLPFIAQLG